MRIGQTRGGRGAGVRFPVWLLAVMAPAALLAPACATPPEGASTPASAPQGVAAGGELRFGLATEPSGLSPTGDRWTTEQFQVARTIYDPLVSYDENYVPKPVLAETVVANDTFTVWTLTVRDGIAFHDGSPFDAEAVRTQLDAARQAPTFSGLLAPITSVETAAARTIEVRLSTPWSAFQHVLASQVGFMAAAPSPAAGAVDRPIGTGPFMWDTATPEQVRVKRSSAYWQKGQPVLDAVDFRIVPDAAVRLRAVRSGQLDVAEVHEPDVEARAERLGGSEGPLQVLTDNSGESPELVIALQSARPPFVSAPARQAVAFGIDREAVSQRLFSGGYPQAYGPYSEGSPWYGQAPWPAWDAGRARQSAQDVMRETGRPLRFTLLFPSDPLYAGLGELLVDELNAAGIGIALEVLSSREVQDRVEAGNYEAALLPLFGGGYPDEDFGLLYGKGISIAPGSSSPNFARFRNTAIDEAIEKSRATGDIGKQADQYQKIQELLAKEAPYVFLVQLQGSIVAGRNVQGMTTWTLPDGSRGISQLKTTVALNQAWVGAPGASK
ncbi:MAG: hypothetical protein HYX32_05120 [Actinobacteria bacterium]|nr:hypothetical protein [Actinomycetota bacterium]